MLYKIIFYPNRLLNARTTCVTCVPNGSFWGPIAKNIDFTKWPRVHEVDFESKVPIDDDKPRTFCASQIFGSVS